MYMYAYVISICVFFFQAEDGIRDGHVTGVQTCALPISRYTRALTLDPHNVAARKNLEIAHRKLFPRCDDLEDALEPNNRQDQAHELPAASLTGPYASRYAERSEERRVGKRGRGSHQEKP